MNVIHNGADGILTVTKNHRQTLGATSQGISRVGSNGLYESCYQYVQATDELKKGEIAFLKSNNTVSKTKDANDNILVFAITNCPANYYCFVGLQGAFVASVAQALKDNIVYFDATNNTLTSDPKEAELQGSAFLTSKDENTNQAIVLIRG